MMFDFCCFLVIDEIFLLGKLLVWADMVVCCVCILWDYCFSLIGFSFYFLNKDWFSNFFNLLVTVSATYRLCVTVIYRRKTVNI